MLFQTGRTRGIGWDWFEDKIRTAAAFECAAIGRARKDANDKLHRAKCCTATAFLKWWRRLFRGIQFVWSPLKFGWAVFSTVARWRGAREFFLERLGRQDDEGLLPLLALSIELIDNNAPDLRERDVLRRTPIGRSAVRLIERNGIEHGLKIPDARRVEISA